jgi:hypothetical protein
MLKIINNAIEIVLQAANELHPNLEADIQFAPVEEGYACTTFPDDGGRPLIDIGLHAPIEAVPELIAHEIAHVVAGKDAEHGDKWDCEFGKIQKKYEEICNAMFREDV